MNKKYEPHVIIQYNGTFLLSQKALDYARRLNLEVSDYDHTQGLRFGVYQTLLITGNFITVTLDVNKHGDITNVFQ